MKDPAAKIMLGLTEVLVLESLRREPKHGYGLLKELEEIFGETPNRNRIYPLLGRLEEEGYVEGRTDPDSSRGKTTYHLTDAGRDRLETYESMPPSFRETLDRFWGTPDRAAGGPDDGPDADDEGPEPEDRGEAQDEDPEAGDREEAPEGPPDGESREPGDGEEAPQGSPDGGGGGSRSGADDDDRDDRDDGGDGGDGDGDDDGAGGGSGGGGDPGGDRGSDGGEGGGMDLRRNPETGEVEMVIRGTHWGEVRIELGEFRGDD